MTVEGFGFEVDSDVCPGVWPYIYRESFEFDAKRDEKKWVVYASPQIKDQQTRESAAAAFESMIDEVINQCEKKSVIKTSWQNG